MKPNNATFNWFMKKLHQRLFFSDILSLHMETYMEILITAWLNFRHPLKTKVGETFSFYFSLYVAVWALLFIPILLAWVVFTNKENLQKASFHSRWGQLVEGVKTRRKAFLLQKPLLLLRRIIWVIICFNLESHGGLQLQIILLHNLFMGIYQTGLQPLTGRLRNRIEIANEMIV